MDAQETIDHLRKKRSQARQRHPNAMVVLWEDAKKAIEGMAKAAQATKNWKVTADEKPEDGELVYCLPQQKLLQWNEYHWCWDDDEGDDYFCDPSDVQYWCRVPDFDIETQPEK